MSDRIQSVILAASAVVVMFPNGAKFDATDGFVGAGVLRSLEFSNFGAGTGTCQLDVFDASLQAAPNRMQVGGTTTPLEAFRLIGGATCVEGQDGSPHWLNAANAQVTGCRRMIQTMQLGAPTTGRTFSVPLNITCATGMIVVVTASSATGTLQIAATYSPWVSGHTRRRRAYDAGSVVKNNTQFSPAL